MFCNFKEDVLVKNGQNSTLFSVKSGGLYIWKGKVFLGDFQGCDIFSSVLPRRPLCRYDWILPKKEKKKQDQGLKTWKGWHNIAVDKKGLVRLGMRKRQRGKVGLHASEEGWQKRRQRSLVDEGKAVHVVFLDFSIGFDTVPHSTLLDKPSSCGMSGFMVCWVKIWPKGRAQSVPVNGAASGWPLLSSVAPSGLNSGVSSVQYIC